MQRHMYLAVAPLLLVPSAVSAQAGLRVQPLSIDVSSPAQAGSLTLENTGAAEISLQMRVFEWSQPDGADKLTPTAAVVASPPAAKIAPGARYTIRVARTARARGQGEAAYRLWIDELPQAASPRAGGGEVDVRLRYDLPVFFHQPGHSPRLTWRAFRSGENVVVEARNAGTRHARVERLKLVSANAQWSFGDGLNGYVLAGATRRWTVPAGGAVPAADGSATIVSGVSGSEVRQPVMLANP